MDNMTVLLWFALFGNLVQAYYAAKFGFRAIRSFLRREILPGLRNLAVACAIAALAAVFPLCLISGNLDIGRFALAICLITPLTLAWKPLRRTIRRGPIIIAYLFFAFSAMLLISGENNSKVLILFIGAGFLFLITNSHAISESKRSSIGLLVGFAFLWYLGFLNFSPESGSILEALILGLAVPLVFFGLLFGAGFLLLWAQDAAEDRIRWMTRVRFDEIERLRSEYGYHRYSQSKADGSPWPGKQDKTSVTTDKATRRRRTRDGH